MYPTHITHTEISFHSFSDKYAEVFECKNKIIETLKKELSRVDEKFVNDQILQKEDISILSTRINNQLEIMKNAYRRHLNLIEVIRKHYDRLLIFFSY